MLGKLFSLLKKPATPEKPAAKTTASTAAHQAPPAAESKARKKSPQEVLQALTGVARVEDIHDTDTLNRLLKNSAQLDKKTNQQIRDRLHTLKNLEHAAQQAQAEQEKLCSRLETLAKLQHHPLFDTELLYLQQQWQAIPQPDGNITTRVQAALSQCLVIQAEAEALKQQAQQQQEQQQRAAAEADAQREQEQRQIEIAQHRQQEALATQALQQEDKKAQQQQQAQAEKHKKQALQRSARQQEIQDWKAFVTLPKLEALCDAMEKLRDTALPLLEKAEAIRDLQAQWRSMKAPGTDEVQVFWQRFQQAGDQAWLPCAEYFEKEKQRRQFNLSQRQAICAALETFAAQQNWAQTDWKSVAKILEKSRKEFHDFYPVERHEEKSIRERFDSAFAAINDKLLEQQQANEARKQQLVDMASSVANMSDTQQATARFKQIQEQWKQIGITRHREEQQLWQALQQHGQNIFEKHRHQQNQLRDAQNEQLRSARAVCEQIAALSTVDDATLTQSSSEFERLQSEFKAITGIPEKLLPGIKKQFATACDSYRQQLAGLATRQHQQQLFELARRAQLCATVETTPDTSSLERINTEWQQLALPADWERAIQQRKQRAVAAAQDQQTLDYAANEQQLRQLCIELEILLDLESPEEDRQHRREYQLQKLQQGLHAASGSSITEKREQLQVRWYGTGCASSSVHSALEARFTAAMAQRRSGKS